jgi:hypothetical protein
VAAPKAKPAPKAAAKPKAEAKPKAAAKKKALSDDEEEEEEWGGGVGGGAAAAKRTARTASAKVRIGFNPRLIRQIKYEFDDEDGVSEEEKASSKRRLKADSDSEFECADGGGSEFSFA